MKKHSFILTIWVLAIGLFSTSCSNEETNTNEFSDWSNKSSEFFSQVLSQARTNINNGDSSWKVIRKWSLPQDNNAYQAANEDHIVAQVLSSGASTQRALTTDSVLVSYKARIIPSENYPQGKVYMKTFEGEYNALTNAIVTIGVTGNMRISGNRQVSVTDGISTALQNMNVGDRWLVYIPAKLGYLYSEYSTLDIPEGSTLIIDLTLVSIKK